MISQMLFMILTDLWTNLLFGTIVLLKFPFSDGRGDKKRPALVILDAGDDDVLVCRITTKEYSTEYDVPINKWEKFGLKLPSVYGFIKWHQ